MWEDSLCSLFSHLYNSPSKNCMILDLLVGFENPFFFFRFCRNMTKRETIEVASPISLLWEVQF